MVSLTRLLAWLGLVCLVAACNTTDARFLRDGVGTDLYTPESADAAHSEDLYIDAICRRAGLAPVGAERCARPDPVSVGEWSAITQAGFNDIDARCDAYLAWLDAKRRNVAPGLQQIGDMSTAVDAFLVASGAGVQPLAFAAAAFGIARNTFTNFHSRLILEVQHSTVQTIVFNRQRDFRAAILRQRIDNRPAAVHAMRNYLRICMPFTIETEINTTITAFERGGARALEEGRMKPLVSASNVGVRLTANEPPTTFRPRPDVPTDPRFAEVFDPYIPRVHTIPRFKRLQEVLCVPDGELGTVGPFTRALIAIFEGSYHNAGDARLNGKLDRDEVAELLTLGRCSGGSGRNYFERRNLDDAETVAQLIVRLNRVPDGGQLPANASLAQARLKIAAVRRAVEARGTRLLPLPPQMRGQMTPDLYIAL